MKALIRQNETYTEPYWSEWTRNNLDREIAINGWSLINDYTPPADEGSAVSEAAPTETQNSGVTLTPEEVARLKEALSSL